MKRIAIIGGGAAGLICAARAAKIARDRNASVRIIVIERDSKVGRPILRSGNGRCNLTNSQIDISAYHNAELAADIFVASDASALDEHEILGSELEIDRVFFTNRGLLMRAESEGRLYPYTNKASTVVELLLKCLDPNYIDVMVDACVAKIVSHKMDTKRTFAVHFEDSRVEHFDSIIVAAGGGAADKILRSIESDAIPFSASNIVQPQPMLCPIAVEESFVGTLDNIRVKCSASLLRDSRLIAREEGEVLFRKYGVSGIAVFNLSRFAQAGDLISIDFMPELSESEIEQLLQLWLHAYTNIHGELPTNVQILEGALLVDIAEQLVCAAGLDPSDAFSNPQSLAYALKHFTLTVSHLADTDKAQVHRGGVVAEAINPQTLESVQIPGLFFAGEIIDVDGPCGGYNLHFAWTSGLLAANSALEAAEVR